MSYLLFIHTKTHMYSVPGTLEELDYVFNRIKYLCKTWSTLVPINEKFYIKRSEIESFYIKSVDKDGEQVQVS